MFFSIGLNMKRLRNCKIVATIGPASDNLAMLDRLYTTGVDVFRLNFSHGSHEKHAEVHKAIRNLEKKYGTCPTIMADLQGPKLRIGTFENDKIILEKDDTFIFDLDPTPGNTKRVCLPHPEILTSLAPGSQVLLDDGKLCLEVISSTLDKAKLKVITGGVLSNRKGVNVPDVLLAISSLTEKDKKDLNFALELGVDWVALSFVQSVKDIEEAREIIKDKALIMTKVEKPLAVSSLDAIVEASDGIMVARGDLGVEMRPEEVPMVQRRMLRVCQRLAKPVVVATHMLESMTHSPSPTRAEVSDVATAVYCGTDATMLSAESASGNYPTEAVRMMSNVISVVEKDPQFKLTAEEDVNDPINTIIDSLCAGTYEISKAARAKNIVLFSDSFEAAARLSRLRPICKTFLVTSDIDLARRAGVLNGVYAFVMKKEFEVDMLIKNARFIIAEKELASPGETIVVASEPESFIKIITL